jgi:hypothetical protein
VLRGGAIDGGLRVDGEEAKLVDLREVFGDDGRFLGRRTVGPRQGGEVAATEAGKEGGDVGE